MKNVDIIRKKDIRRLLLAVAMTACVFSAAHAETLSPKSEIRLQGDVLTLGDVFPGVTANADHVLAPAPAFGKKTVLGSRDLQRISDAFSLGWRPESAMAQAVISRDGVEIDRHDIQAALQEKLAERMAGQKFDVELNDPGSSFFLPAGGKDFEIGSLDIDPVKGNFRARLTAENVRKELSGKIYALMEIPVLDKALRNGDVITEADIRSVEMRAKDVSPNLVIDVAKLVGQTPRRGLPAMRPVQAADIMSPVLVKKGDSVTMTLSNGVIHLTATGRALDEGAEGDVVRVMNTSSDQVIEAVVSGERHVTVGGTAPQAVAAADKKINRE